MRMDSKRPRLMPLEGEEFSQPIKNYPEDDDYELPHKSNLMARGPQNDKPFEFKLAPLRSISDSIPYYQQQHSPIPSQQVGSPLPSKVPHLVVPSGGMNGSSVSGQNPAVTSLVDLPEGYDLTIMTQPVGYQIANYNIHPAPALTVNKPVNSNITIHAQLVENDRKSVIDGGFQSGDVRVLRAGHTTIYFTGLKLSKMGPIKTELHYRDYKRIPTTFRILFKIGNKQIFTDPFKLVSSCAQLPQEVRDIVRPTKKMPKSGGSPDNSGSEDTPTPPKSHGSNGLTLDAEMTQLRRELDNSIESADVEAAGQAAQRLAYLKKLQMAHLLLHQSPEPSPSLPLAGPPPYQHTTKT